MDGCCRRGLFFSERQRRTRRVLAGVADGRLRRAFLLATVGGVSGVMVAGCLISTLVVFVGGMVAVNVCGCEESGFRFSL